MHGGREALEHGAGEIGGSEVDRPHECKARPAFAPPERPRGQTASACSGKAGVRVASVALRAFPVIYARDVVGFVTDPEGNLVSLGASASAPG